MEYPLKLNSSETEVEPYLMAVQIVKQLSQHGHTTYMAGGCVRDWLLGRNPEDIDLATSAPAELVCSLFEKTVRTGMQFESVRVIEQGHSIEVSSFRSDGLYLDGRRPTSIRPASACEDAQRRDFTINGLFYCPLSQTVFDYVNGSDDLKKRILRTIGDPLIRFNEDRLRLIRAIRLACKLQFKIGDETYQAITKLSHTVQSVSKERIHDELTKICSQPLAEEAFSLLVQTQLLEKIFQGCVDPPIKFDLAEAKSPFSFWPICWKILSKETGILTSDMIQKSAENLCLSKYEKQALAFAGRFGQALKKDPDLSQISTWCRLVASPFYEELKIFLQKEQVEILNKIAISKEIFIKKLQTCRYLISGESLQKLGIQGPLIGELLEKATDLAIEENYLEEDKILNLLHKKGWINNFIC
ncbi:CCA tRNA nucleotidyltransferase [Candidatus Similichlamydia epinepheli]|uniref:CCA tRNA nucleotidyltransferase n=1 Tax=Candidatus Similichlamydia epinepheli TaxID=1903953 RepID=UPI000D351995|nr:CCA tRNA nucleotidyltransferase [Candidatus Similichlamydia epinepheli]